MSEPEPHDPSLSDEAQQVLDAVGRPNALPWQHATDDTGEHECFVSGQMQPQPHTLTLEAVLDGYSPVGPIDLRAAVVVAELEDGFWCWKVQLQVGGDHFADADVAMLDAERWLHEAALAVPPAGY